MSYKKLKAVEYLVVHCSDTPSTLDIGVTEITRWHRQRGWLDVGYHFVIRRNGVVEKGRSTDVPAAHARGYNHISLGICMVGGTDDKKSVEANFTPEQYESLRELLDELRGRHPDAEILGHRDLPRVRKLCPCFDVSDWFNRDLKEEPKHS